MFLFNVLIREEFYCFQLFFKSSKWGICNPLDRSSSLIQGENYERDNIFSIFDSLPCIYGGCGPFVEGIWIKLERVVHADTDRNLNIFSNYRDRLVDGRTFAVLAKYRHSFNIGSFATILCLVDRLAILIQIVFFKTHSFTKKEVAMVQIVVRKKGERGQVHRILVILLGIIICVMCLLVLIPVVNSYIADNAHIYTIRTVPLKVPWAIVQAIPVTQLDESVEAVFPCTIHIRLMFLDGTGYIPDNGRFGIIQAPYQKVCDQISWSVGTLGYEPEKDYAVFGGDFQFSVIGLMATSGNIPVGAPMLNPEYDAEFNPTVPIKDWWKKYLSCSVNFVKGLGSQGISELVGCEQSGFFNYAIADWKGPGAGYQCTVWILTRDDDNIGVYCINETPELLSLLDNEQVSEDLMRSAVNMLNNIPDSDKPWYKQFGQ